MSTGRGVPRGRVVSKYGRFDQRPAIDLLRPISILASITWNHWDPVCCRYSMAFYFFWQLVVKFTAVGAFRILARLDLGDKAQRVGWLERLISPLLLFVIAWALARSTFITWRQGGIKWRETFYSIADLRRGQRLKF